MSEIDVSKYCCYENGKCLWTKRYYENNIVPDCEKVKDCYYKQLQQLKQENEELKQDLQKESEFGHKAICEEADSFFEVMKLQKVLDEIEDICTHETINLTDSCVNGGRYFEILRRINEVKGEK